MIEIARLIAELMPVLRDIISMSADNIQGLESSLRDLTAEIGNRVMKFKLETMDKELSDSSTNLCKCAQGAVVHREKRGRQILTTYGKVEIKRTMSQCQGCGQTRFVLDEALGLEAYKRVSPMLKKLALLCGASWSYQKASEVLSELLGVEDVISAKQIEKLSRGEAEKVEEKEEIEHEQIMDSVMLDYRETVPGRVYVDVDGGMVNSRDDDNEQSQRMEGKVAAIWSKKIKVKGRKEIVDRFYLGTFNSYKQLVGGINDQLWSRCGSRRQEIEIVLRGDGANWIRQMKKDYFHRALYMLDWYHLTKKVRERLEQSVEDDGQRQGVEKELKDLVYEGKVDEALGKLEGLKTLVMGLQGQEAIDRLIAYINRNREGMWYKEARERGIDIGVGTAEKAVDLVICRRFKQRGMRWTRAGANALVKIRLLILNDKWNQYWDSKLAA